MTDELNPPNAQVDLTAPTPPPVEAPVAKTPVEPWVNVKTATPTNPPVKLEPATLMPPEPEPVKVKEEVKEESNLDTQSDQLDKVLEQVKEERDRLRQLNKSQMDRERLIYLREIGAKDGVSDIDLLKLAPGVDPNTPEGRAQLDSWREQAHVYFDQRNTVTQVDVNQLAKGYKTSSHGTFGQNLAANLLNSMGRKK